MLRFLKIRHLAVIDEVELEFEPGLNVLTGETGAGKSILVQAVGLLLGGRASADLVRTGEETAMVEAIFERDGAEVLVRREVTAQGRSRAFVDGNLTTAGALQEIADSLIELHGQHEHQTLLDPGTHLAALDAYGSLEPLVAPVTAAFEVMRRAREELARLERVASGRASRQEFVAFQLAELERAALQPGEDETLLATRQVLANADRVERLCRESYADLYESDSAILARLGGVWRRITDLAALDPRVQPYLAARDDIKSQLEDLALFLARYAENIEASPARLQEVEERLSLLERLKRKHGPSLEDVIRTRDALVAELAELDESDGRIHDLQTQLAAARRTYLAEATTLSAARHEAAGRFARRLEELLGELAMERTRIEIRFAGEPLAESDWTGQGTDRAEFFVSPNVGEELRPLARIVSGGELSRIMLAIKTLTASARRGFSQAVARPPSAAAPGLIFDEVDAGIGGRVADVVGRELRTLGSAFQVLCITHLPQIAAYADTHFRIEKHVGGGRTRTSVARLDRDGRMDELARMLGGATVTPATRETAGELLAARQAQGRKAKGESERAKAKVLPGRKSDTGKPE